jgi:hypothetical protein
VLIRPDDVGFAGVMIGFLLAPRVDVEVLVVEVVPLNMRNGLRGDGCIGGVGADAGGWRENDRMDEEVVESSPLSCY